MLDGRSFWILGRGLNGTSEETVAESAEIGDGDTDIADIREFTPVVIRRFEQRLTEDRNVPEQDKKEKECWSRTQWQ
jgi:hypothetical protein